MTVLLNDVPDNVTGEHWRSLCAWKTDTLGRERSARGVHARRHLKVGHSLGSRPYVVGYGEMICIYNTSIIIIIIIIIIF